MIATGAGKARSQFLDRPYAQRMGSARWACGIVFAMASAAIIRPERAIRYPYGRAGQTRPLPAQPPDLRIGRSIRQLQRGGARIQPHPALGQPQHRPARGPSRRAAVHPQRRRHGADARGPDPLSGAGRRLPSGGGRAEPPLGAARRQGRGRAVAVDRLRHALAGAAPAGLPSGLPVGRPALPADPQQPARRAGHGRSRHAHEGRARRRLPQLAFRARADHPGVQPELPGTAQAAARRAGRVRPYPAASVGRAFRSQDAVGRHDGAGRPPRAAGVQRLCRRAAGGAERRRRGAGLDLGGVAAAA